MKQLTRVCPACKSTTIYRNKTSYKVALVANKLCRSCTAKSIRARQGMSDLFISRFATKGQNVGTRNPFYGHTHTEDAKTKMQAADKSYTKTPEFKQKISAVTSGPLNPMYGKSLEKHWRATLDSDEADRRILQHRQRLSVANSGEKNPMYGRPSPTGSGNGWSGWYKGWYFRSLKELAYVVGVLEPSGNKWRSGESLKIKYTDWQGKSRTYSPDFIIDESIVVEVKPSKLKSSVSVRLKQLAAEEYCQRTGMVYQITDPSPLTDDQIRSLHQSKLIQFIDRYERMYSEKWGRSKGV